MLSILEGTSMMAQQAMQKGSKLRNEDSHNLDFYFDKVYDSLVQNDRAVYLTWPLAQDTERLIALLFHCSNRYHAILRLTEGSDFKELPNISLLKKWRALSYYVLWQKMQD